MSDALSISMRNRSALIDPPPLPYPIYFTYTPTPPSRFNTTHGMKDV
ncbi:MAG: hypothetical protein PF442_01495 [Desulfobulbaceae bacterium]|nr:hypothetical protein [Desulfobulbaceae bacterium]